MCTYVLKCIFWKSNLKSTYVLKCIFWGSNFEEHIFFEEATYVLKCMNNLFKVYGCWLVRLLLNSVVADLYFLSKFSPQVKNFAILTCINTNLRCIKDCRLMWTKQTDGPGLCFKDQYEDLQISRNNCQLPGKPW